MCLAGTKIDRLSIHRKTHVAKPAAEAAAGRWAHHVGSHPVRYAVVGLAAMVAIAIPALAMRIGVPDDGNAPTGTTQRIAFDQLAAGFGHGSTGPILVVVELPGSRADVILDHAATSLRSTLDLHAGTHPPPPAP